MQKEKEGLEDVMEQYSLEELKETLNLLEDDLEKNPCNGNKIRYYSCQITYHNKLIEKTIGRLNECDRKLEFSLNGIKNNFGMIWNYKHHKKLKGEIKSGLKEYSDKLENYKKEYEKLHPLKDVNSNL